MAGRSSPFVMYLVFLAIFFSCTWQSTHAQVKLTEGNGRTERSIPINVTVFYYNSSYDRDPFNRVLYNQVTYYRAPNITKYFVDLFKKVEDNFQALPVDLVIKVQNVSEREDLVVYNKSINKIDQNKTLEKVKEYWMNTSAKPNDAYYFFVLDKFIEADPYNTSDPTGVVATNGTLCSENASAAVVRHMFPNGMYYNRSSRALAYMLGSRPIRHFSAVNKTDLIDQIRPVLERCRKEPKIEEQAVSKEAVKLQETSPTSSTTECLTSETT